MEGIDRFLFVKKSKPIQGTLFCMKDWKGNSKSTYITLGASNHTEKERQSEDYYATDPIAVDKLVKHYPLPTKVWEPACGAGHLVGALERLGHEVYASDLVDRGCGDSGVDFLMEWDTHDCDAIVTNPPYRYAMEFVLHAMEILPIGGVAAFFLKTLFLEGQTRYEKLFSKYPPRYVLQFSKRVLCAKNGDFDGMKAGGGSAVAYAWYVWQKGYNGETIVKWI